MTHYQDKVLSNRLRKLGCPYGIDDPRSRIWLEGHAAAINNEVKKLGRELAA